jgi:hypothetical protein
LEILSGAGEDTPHARFDLHNDRDSKARTVSLESVGHLLAWFAVKVAGYRDRARTPWQMASVTRPCSRWACRAGWIAFSPDGW